MLDPPTAVRLALATRNRLSSMRGPLLEAMNDPNSGALGQGLVGAFADLATALENVERALRDAMPPRGQGFAGP